MMLKKIIQGDLKYTYIYDVVNKLPSVANYYQSTSGLFMYESVVAQRQDMIP